MDVMVQARTIRFTVFRGTIWFIRTMSYSRKKPNSRFEDMEFPGVSKKWHVEFPGMNQRRNGISKGDRKNNVQFLGVLVFGLEISKRSNTILWNF